MKSQVLRFVFFILCLFGGSFGITNAQSLIWEISQSYIPQQSSDVVERIIKYNDSTFIAIGQTDATFKNGKSGIAYIVLNSNVPKVIYKDTLGIYGRGIDILSLKNGNLVLGITEANFISGGYHPTLMEVDLSGGVFWQKSYSKVALSQNTSFRCMTHTPDGGYIIAGGLSKPGTAFYYQVFATALDSAGTVLWDVSFPSYYVTQCYDINPQHDGSYLMTCVRGHYLMAFSIDPVTGNLRDSLIIDSISAGTRIWSASIKQSPDGGFVATYRSNTITNQKAYIAKYDSTWKTEWKHQVGMFVLEPFINKDTSVCIFGHEDVPNNSFHLGYTKKYDKNGSLMWNFYINDSSFLGSQNTHFQCVAYDENKEAVLGGYNAGSAGQDFYFAKIANFGEPYEPDFCASSPAAAFTFSQTADSLFLIDSSYSGLSLNPHLSYEWYVDNQPLPKDSVTAMALTAQNYTKTKTVKLIIKNWYGCVDSVERVINLWPLGVEKENLKQPKVRVFPNPARDILNIETSEPGRVFIYAMDGRLVLERDVARGTNKIVPPGHGLYLIRFIGEKGFAVRKVLVE